MCSNVLRSPSLAVMNLEAFICFTADDIWSVLLKKINYEYQNGHSGAFKFGCSIEHAGGLRKVCVF